MRLQPVQVRLASEQMSHIIKETQKPTSLFSSDGTGIGEEDTDTTVPVIAVDTELLEAMVVMEDGLVPRPGLLPILLVVGVGGCCFFLTA